MLPFPIIIVSSIKVVSNQPPTSVSLILAIIENIQPNLNCTPAFLNYISKFLKATIARRETFSDGRKLPETRIITAKSRHISFKTELFSISNICFTKPLEVLTVTPAAADTVPLALNFVVSTQPFSEAKSGFYSFCSNERKEII